MAKASDFYAVLGVERGADEREIKKAYFRLVRQYPPETHPEEFKLIREAYEVLGQGESRAEYDNLTRYGERAGERLRAGMEAMERGDLVAAQEAFQEVLTEQPDLLLARDLLGMAFLNNNQPREALRHFDLLVSAHDAGPDGDGTASPRSGKNDGRANDNPSTYYLHKGYAHYALDQYPDAVAAYLQAQGLCATDTRVLVALSDCHTAMERYEDALRELDLAIHMDGEVDFQDFVFFMRKVQIQLLRDRTDLADQEIDQIFRVMPEDPEVRKYVAQKLASLAAQLFRIKRSADGNRLLRRAQELLGGKRRLPAAFPARATQRLRDLPRASQAEIARLAREPSPWKLQHGAWGGPVLLLLGALFTLVFSVGSALSAQVEWRGNTQAVMAAMLLCGPALLCYAVQRALRVARSKLGRFTTIHPLYLLQVDLDEVTAWPLVNLHDVSMTHHLQNGVYQYTAIKADFAGVHLTLTIRGQQAAVDWAQSLLDARHRCLGLLSVGMLEEEEGVDILPQEMLEGRLVPPGRMAGSGRRAQVMSYGAAALCGVGLLLGGMRLNSAAAERSLWRHAQALPRAFGYRAYLRAYPQGERAAAAHERLAGIYEQAKERYLSQVGDAPGKQAIVDVLDALQQAPSQEVLVRYTATVDMDAVRGKPLPDGTLPIQADRAFTRETNQKREAAITHSLSRAFQRVLEQDVLSLVSEDEQAARHARRGQRAQRGQGPGVIFAVSYRVSPSGEMYRSAMDQSALYGIQLDWTLAIHTGPARAPYTLSLLSHPAQSIRYVKQSDEDDEIVPYTKMAESAFEEFGHKVAAEFGVSLQGLAHPALEVRGGVSPEARRRLQDLARRGHVSAEELESLMRSGAR